MAHGDVQSPCSRHADGPEHDRLYAEQAKIWPGFLEYQKRTSRVIPVVVLERIQNEGDFLDGALVPPPRLTSVWPGSPGSTPRNDSQDELRQCQHPAPPPGLLSQPVQPLKTELPHPARCPAGPS
jgi:hypothetical protein